MPRSARLRFARPEEIRAMEQQQKAGLSIGAFYAIAKNVSGLLRRQGLGATSYNNQEGLGVTKSVLSILV